MTKLNLFSAVCCLMLAGCAQMPGTSYKPPLDARTLKCDSAKCAVQVAVQCYAYVFCYISAEYDVIEVRPGNAPEITWQVATPGYTFSENGIAIADGGEFDCRPTEGRRRFVCNNKHSKPGTYKYTITLIGFPFVFPLDPWIVNG